MATESCGCHRRRSAPGSLRSPAILIRAGAVLARRARIAERGQHAVRRFVALAWYVGLDADGTKIGDALWNGAELDEATRATIVGLFRLTFCDPRIVLERLSGEPVYLILAMTPGKMLRMKPQNLLTSLPIRGVETMT